MIFYNTDFLDREYKFPATALLTPTGGLLVNFHGFCFFCDNTKEMKYRVWKETKFKGRFPVPTQEYGRIKKNGAKEIFLSASQETKIKSLITLMLSNELFRQTGKIRKVIKKSHPDPFSSKHVAKFRLGDVPGFNKIKLAN